MAAERVLVIVESPAKAKTIEGYLNGRGGRDFRVKASVGHVRDLASKASELPEDQRKQPWSKYAVNTDDGFVVECLDPAGKATMMVEMLLAHGVRPERLVVRPADLQSVFLRLTGRGMRDG